MKSLRLLPALSVAFSLAFQPAFGAEPRGAAELRRVMDQYHLAYQVFSDFGSGGNHFNVRAMIGSAPPMTENSTQSPHSGLTCIRATYDPRVQPLWGGDIFMIGAAPATAASPQPNWGTLPNAGVNLTGATRLTFWARGDAGGERVKFFCLGIGRDPDSGIATERYPDSARQLTTNFVTLSSSWQQYSISLSGLDLSYVVGGFGWVTSAVDTSNRTISFALDDIQFERAQLDAPRFLVSYKATSAVAAFDTTMINTAITEDNALTLLALLALGDNARAKLIADALVYAMNNDRYYSDSRLRNGYSSGDLVQPPAWEPNGRKATARLPGSIGAGGDWREDGFMVGTSARTMAWSALALVAYADKAGGSAYLAAAGRLGDWIESNLRDTRGAGGYLAGFVGSEPTPTLQRFKSTEDNAVLYAAFARLRRSTGDQKWDGRATHARNFVLAMWDGTGGLFWTGTDVSGTAINRTTIPLGAQTRALLALRDLASSYSAALTFAEQNHRLAATGTFDFDTDRDGSWYQGSMEMALAYLLTRQSAKAAAALATAQSGIASSGALYAASIDGLTTGYESTPGEKWVYYRREHVGATAWAVLAESGANPFWVGTEFANLGAVTEPAIHMSNLSTRAATGPGALVLTSGFAVGPATSKPLLLRAVGPALAAAPFNLTGTLADPFLTLYDSSGAVIATNDNWGTATGTMALSAASFAAVGAFALPSGSRDAAILITLAPGNYTAQVSGAPGTNGAGLAIVEIYELDAGGAKLINLSTRGQVLSGANLMLPGIVIPPGAGSLRLLIRAAGPALAGAPFNVPGTLADPTIILTDSKGVVVATNDNWGTPVGAGASSAAALSSVFGSVGAFPFASGSRDSALLVTLPPGNYGVQVTGVGGGTGVAIVEVYEVP